MSALVVYESMFGNTHLIADAIGRGLASTLEVSVVPVAEVDAVGLAGADVVVVGGPTHAHGMSRASTRQSAVAQSTKEGSDVELDPDAEGPGLRDWFADVGAIGGKAAAFDTRIDAPPVLTGQASKGIARQLRRHGCELVAEPMSFLVHKDSHLEAGEDESAQRWGAALAAAVAPRPSSDVSQPPAGVPRS